MVEYKDIDKGSWTTPTYTVAITLIDGSMLVYENSTGATPKANFLLIGFVDHTIILPDHQIQVVTIRPNQGETK